ncbi:response regulator [Thalassotalea sp. 1_MG-2023]|uniref:tetratricopeptide repeat-containing response regulator n=1 Tax=Thalassotalea sp. 1_MG-2023 TaxID=3062680 RepID=UPI0026E28321|nr:tetratricopeptide repeat-containing response regulator [Thalassotalea sp. 1_MG-2023]MDO6428550.1 response regulator [Thalassotalea sp. 1_MG-2023]
MVNIDYGSKRFLIVDNIKQSRDTLKIFAYSLGVLSVETSYHAPDIIALCEATAYDVVLLGYDLGDNKKNGQQILEELRAKNLLSRQCNVIMITAEVSQAMVLAALEHKPDEYLIKPYTLKDLSTRLTRTFEKKVAMAKIYQALDKNDRKKVIQLCNHEAYKNSPYKHECLGIRSRQHFELGEYQQARKIYSAYVGTPNCQWATIGLGKIALVEQNYHEAEKCFQAIVDDNPFYLSAYDWLAKSQIYNNDYEKAEQTLEQALLVSPRSVTRLKQYAEICLNNNSLGKATSALSKTNDLAYHSIHKKPDNAIQFAEALIGHADSLSESQIRKLNDKAFTVLNNMTRDFQANELKVIAQFLIARLHTKAKDVGPAQSALKEAERLLETYKKVLTTEGTFKVARSLIALQRRGKAEMLLENLSQAHPDNMEILSEVVALSDRPISEKDKIAAQTALEVGVSLYKAKHYTLAIDKLNQALYHFPHHIGVKLNLLQVLLVSYEANKERIDDFKQAKVLIKHFNELSPESESFKRFLKLRSKFEALNAFNTH